MVFNRVTGQSSRQSTSGVDLLSSRRSPDVEGQNGARDLTLGMTSLMRPPLARMAKAVLLVLVFGVFSIFIWSMHHGTAVNGRYSGESMTKTHFDDIHIPSYAADDHDSSGRRRLHMFMPADNPAINLCKTIMSSVALGYPLPIILNWHGEFNRPEWHFSGSHIAKLESLLDVIDTLLRDHADDAHPEDIALLVDAYDIWFQLPPSVLIERFHQLNREADDRNRRLWESLSPAAAADFPVPPPRQKIVITTAKHCSPDADSGSDPNYPHWPESPLPGDFYGDGTDQVVAWADSARKFARIRPRCVNSGMIMGTMGALRDALERARDKVDEVARRGRQIWSDQALIGEVIGDQELWREWIRDMAETWNGTVAENRVAGLRPETRAIAEAAMHNKTRFEFGIGLDYNFTTIPPTCSAEDDGYFVNVGDEAALVQESRKAGVPDGVRVTGIPSELRDHPGPVPGDKWDEVPLYTDFFFGTSPVGIHHNAYVGNLKSTRLKEWWDKMWFFPHLRELVTKHLQSDDNWISTPLAKLRPAREGSKGLEYYASKLSKEKKNVRVYQPSKDFGTLSWDGVCQKGSTPWYDELFADNRGPLKI